VDLSKEKYLISRKIRHAPREDGQLMAADGTDEDNGRKRGFLPRKIGGKKWMRATSKQEWSSCGTPNRIAPALGG